MSVIKHRVTTISWRYIDINRCRWSEDTYTQPSIPPLPVPRILPLQVSGNHSSNVTFDRCDVDISSAILHKFTETSGLGRAHVGSLSRKEKLTAAATYSRTWRVLLRMCTSGVNDRHLVWKSDIARTPKIKGHVEMYEAEWTINMWDLTAIVPVR